MGADNTKQMQHILKQLHGEFPALAVQIITTYLDQSKPYNADFAAHPDDPRHHKPQWHQWGIITHTERFLAAFDNEVQGYIAEWGMRTAYDAAMSEMIDGIRKEDLLRMGILYHDLGKFAVRHLSKKQYTTDTKYPDFSFGGHEAASETLLHKHCTEHLQSLGMTSQQIWYVGRCAALHYEIAKIRDRVKNTEGYSLRFAQSDAFEREAKLLLMEFQDFAMEVGLMYLGDSCAKTAFRLSPAPENDTELLVHPQIPDIKRLIAAAGLPANHIDCVLHLNVSVAAVKKYMELM